MSFNPDTPAVRQTGPWQCSAASSAWVLRSLGLNWSQDDVVGWLGPNITEESGLQDGSGRMLAALFRERGFDADFGPISWERALEMAGQQPFCLGGSRWNHWTAVRGTDGQKLLLANPAPSWQGVGDDLDRGEWDAWGDWKAAWVNLAPPVPTLDELEAASPGFAKNVLDWQRARYRNHEDPNDYAACRTHLRNIGVRDPGEAEFDGFRRATIEELAATTPNIRQNVLDWQQARRQNGQDPNDYAACRQHLRNIGCPDPGPAEFLGFFS
jgi:hypothetical protein